MVMVALLREFLDCRAFYFTASRLLLHVAAIGAALQE